jgi:predicted dehydrogenase
MKQPEVTPLSPPIPCHAPSPPVPVCVVGTHWGETHLQALRQAAPEIPLFVCGLDPRRTLRIARRWKAEDALIGLEAAVRHPRVAALTLALPHHLHCQAAELALRAGKPVLVEKPIATTLPDADRLIAAARAAGSLLMVAENMHYRPTLAAVWRRIQAGDLGTPLHLLAQTGGPRHPDGWVADRAQLGGGVFLDTGIHYVRAMRLLLGEPAQAAAFRPAQIRATSGEDGLSVIFSQPGAWQCHIVATWAASLGKLPDIVLAGSRGSFHLWPRAGYFDYYPIAPRRLTALAAYIRPHWLRARIVRPEWQRVRTRLGRPDDGYREEMCAFLNAIAAREAGLASALAARRDLEIVLCAYRSLETGRTETIPPWLLPARAQDTDGFLLG